MVPVVAGSVDEAVGNLGKGATPIPGGAVAQVGNAFITRRALNHRMTAIVGGDLYELAGIVAPKGLVSDPPHSEGCVAALERIVKRRPNPGARELEAKCERLNDAVRFQALTTLIEAQWAIARDQEFGVSVRDAEVAQLDRHVKAVDFGTSAQYQRYLERRGWTDVDERNLLRRDLLAAKLIKNLRGKGGIQAVARYGHESIAKGRAETSCRSGYVVADCREYSSAVKVPVPEAVVREIAAWAR